MAGVDVLHRAATLLLTGVCIGGPSAPHFHGPLEPHFRDNIQMAKENKGSILRN